MTTTTLFDAITMARKALADLGGLKWYTEPASAGRAWGGDLAAADAYNALAEHHAAAEAARPKAPLEGRAALIAAAETLCATAFASTRFPDNPTAMESLRDRVAPLFNEEIKERKNWAEGIVKSYV